MNKPTIAVQTQFPHKGFQLTFENGYTISVQIGRMNYSNGQTNAEVAAWDDNGNFINLNHLGGIDVIGWCNPNDILILMNKVANL